MRLCSAKSKNSKVASKRIKSTTLKPLCGTVGAIWVPFFGVTSGSSWRQVFPLARWGRDKINGSNANANYIKLISVSS